MFIIRDGESLNSSYSRLDVLQMKIQKDLDVYTECFDVNGEFIKGMIIEILS